MEAEDCLIPIFFLSKDSTLIPWRKDLTLSPEEAKSLFIWYARSNELSLLTLGLTIEAEPNSMSSRVLAKKLILKFFQELCSDDWAWK